MSNKNLDKYFKVITSESNGIAEIILYGYIGQDYWWNEDLKEESITDIEFIKTLRELEKKHNRINIRINSPGGSMYHGNAIISAIQSSTSEIHTYNDGMAASMAGDIWLCAKNRHMAKNALLMLHSPSSWVFGNAVDMREEANTLDKFENTIIIMMSDSTGMSREEIKQNFYDGKDYWLDYDDCREMNFLKDVEEEYTTNEVTQNVENISYRDIIKQYQKGNQQKTNISKSVTKNKIENKNKSEMKNTIIAFLKSFGKSVPANASDEQLEQMMKEITADQMKAEIKNELKAELEELIKNSQKAEVAETVANKADEAAKAAQDQAKKADEKAENLTSLMKKQNEAMTSLVNSMNQLIQNNKAVAKSVANHIAKSDESPLVNSLPADKKSLSEAIENNGNLATPTVLDDAWGEK